MATHEPQTARQLKLGPDDQGRVVSDEEFATAEFVEPWKYERVEGRVVVMAPDGQQQVSSTNPWRDAFIVYKLNHPDRIDDVVTNAWVRLGGTDRIGDIGICLVSDHPAAQIPDRVPEIMFEIVSPGREAHERDYVEKRAEYHRLGVREYVVVDRFQQRVTVFTHAPSDYQERILTLAETYTSTLLPGLAIPLAEVMKP
jgi:Uma2 family endonuclease